MKTRDGVATAWPRLVVAVCAALGSLNATAELPPAGSVKIESFSYNGPGCPIGSGAGLISGDASALTVMFDSFTAVTGPAAPRDYKACTLDVRLTVPAGWSFGLFQTQIRGFANLSPGSLGTQRSRYTFGAQRLSVSAKDIRGPFANDYLHNESVALGSLVYSPCGGGGRSLSILTSLEVNGANSLMTVDSIDHSLKQTYGMSWRRCSGTQSIGPVPLAPHPTLVRAIDADTGRDVAHISAYDPAFRGGVRVAACDLNGDGVADVVTGAGPGGGPHVRAFDGRNGAQLGGPLGSFFAYDANFKGGVFVGCGDVDRDGREDLITGAGAGAGPHVIVRSGASGQIIRSFFAYDPNFKGGVSVASTDLNGDGFADIVTGAGPGAAPHVMVYDGRTGQALRSFFAYDVNFRGGVRVAGGDVNNDGLGDVITGAGFGGGPHVTVRDGRTDRVLHSFFAYDAKFLGGVSVSSADIDGDGVNDIIVGALKGGGPHVRVINGLTGLALEGWNGSFWGYDMNFRGGIEVAGAPASRKHTSAFRRFFFAPSTP